jgi:beta-aspartyl-peptidase (threonine type)
MYALALHGGAGVISKDLPQDKIDEYIKGLEQALNEGIRVLRDEKGSAMDAVEQVVRSLEDNPLFNAGKGSVLAHDGSHELEASIMDGKSLKCGAVSGCKTIKNPVSLARKVMEKTPHIWLAYEGAEKFADGLGNAVERVPQQYFTVDRRYEQWRIAREQQKVKLDFSKDKPTDSSQHQGVTGDYAKGTVGCVALDVHGNLAAATSTGGLTNKMVGRTGDTPMIGAGNYANKYVAVSGTGVGEHFIRHCVSHTVASYFELKQSTLKEACDYVVHQKLEPDDGGVVAVSHTGEISMIFNSAGMFRACADSNGTYTVKIWE